MKNKLWACFLIFLICFCFIFFKYAYDDAKKTAIKDLNEKQVIYARQASIGINDVFDNWTNLLISITQVPAIVNLDEEGRNYISFTYEINKADITAVTRVDAEGKILFTSPFNPKAIGQDISGQKHVQEVIRSHKPAVSDVFKSVQGFDMVALHVPVMKNGKFQGTLGIGINFRNLAKKYIESIRIGETGYAWMISRDGTELYSPVPGHTGKSVFENYKEYPSIIAMADEMIKGKQGITTYTFDHLREQKVELVKKHAVYMPIHIGQTFWSIVVASSENEMLSSLKHFRNSLILVIGLFFAGGAMFSFFGLKGWFIAREEQKRKQAEEKLSQSEENFRHSLDHSPMGVRIVTEKGETLYANRAILNFYGYESMEDLNATPVEKRYTPESYAEYMIRREKRQQDVDVPPEYEINIIRKDGEVRCLSVQRSEILWDGEKQFQVLYSDITDRKRAEEALRKSEEILHLITDNMSDMVRVMDLQGVNLYSSPSHFKGLGYRPEERVGKSAFEIVHPDDLEHIIKVFSEGLVNKKPVKVEYRVKHAEGHYIFLETIGDVILNDQGEMTAVVMSSRDITDRKQTENKLRENDQKLRNLANNLSNAMVYQLAAEPDGGRRFTYVSSAVERLNETTEKEVLADAGVIYGQVLPEYHSLVREREEEALKNLTTMQVEVQSRMPSGRLRWFEYTSTPHQQADGLIVWNGVEMDITKRKQDEEKIKVSLREKDILISEIHHRVKNNLQVMSGLLKLQERASKNPEAIEDFRESQDRIRAMAMIHEKLHNSKDFTKIDLAGYMKSLSQELFISHNIHPGKIDLSIEISEDIILDVSKAIPCALVMNELISNALKHAFPSDRPGKLKIIIRETESKELEIIVHDNGVGMPDDIDIDELQSVGLYLVNGLVKNQIHGQIEVKRDNGTEFRITFPL